MQILRMHATNATQQYLLKRCSHKPMFYYCHFLLSNDFTFRMQYKSCNNYNVNVIFEHNNRIKEVNETSYEMILFYQSRIFLIP